jgi:pantothenate kinase
MLEDENSTGFKDVHLNFYSRELRGEFHFVRFETRRIKEAMQLIQKYNMHLDIHYIGATGGGAHKYAKDWEDGLDIRMEKYDELDSVVAGMQFILSDVVGERHTFTPEESDGKVVSSIAVDQLLEVERIGDFVDY